MSPVHPCIPSMDVNKSLLNPFFEGYKLSFSDAIKVEYYPLETCAMQKSTPFSSDYHVMADEIYENKMKSSGNGLFYYISCAGDLISFSRDTLKTFIVHLGPIDSFTITETGVIVVLKGNSLTVLDNPCKSSFELAEISGKEFKLLKAKKIKEKNSLIVLLQSIGKMDNFNKDACEKLREKPAFGFYRIELVNCDFSSCDLLGWSLSRPSVVMVEEIEAIGDRILLGTCSGVVSQAEDEELARINDPIDVPSELGHVFNDDEDDDEENELLNNCRLTEFINSKASETFQFPEFTVSGICANEFQVPVKYLHNVIVYDFRGNLIKPEHVSTFPAINFIQNGKIDKKFTLFSEMFAFIMESKGNIYCYSKPDEAKVSSQYLIQLGDEEILGWAHEKRVTEVEDGAEIGKEVLFLLAKEKIYKIEI